MVPLPDEPATPVVDQALLRQPDVVRTAPVRLEARSYSPPGELQSIEVTGATGGTYTLTYGGQTTAPIAFNAVARPSSQRSRRCRPSPRLPTDRKRGRRRGLGGLYLIRFAGKLRALNVEQVTASAAGLTPSGLDHHCDDDAPGGKDESFEDFLETRPAGHRLADEACRSTSR